LSTKSGIEIIALEEHYLDLMDTVTIQSGTPADTAYRCKGYMICVIGDSRRWLRRVLTASCFPLTTASSITHRAPTGREIFVLAGTIG